MSELILLCGIPGAGKSTYRDKFLKGTYVSTDKIRLDYFHVQYDTEVEPKVWDIAFSMVEEGLARGETIIFDATNVMKRTRAPLIKIAQKYDSKVRAVFMDASLDLALKRNTQREAQVPDEVIIRKHEELEIPEKSEGIHEIKMVKSNTTDGK